MKVRFYRDICDYGLRFIWKPSWAIAHQRIIKIDVPDAVRGEPLRQAQGSAQDRLVEPPFDTSINSGRTE